MKKVFMILLAAVLLLSVSSGAALAADATFNEDSFNAGNNYRNTTDSTVTLSLSNYFTVTIPPDFIFYEGDGDSFSASGEVKLDVTRVGVSDLINITVSSDNVTSQADDTKYWNLTAIDGSGKKIQYQMKNGTTSTDHINPSTPSSHLVKSGDKIISSGVDKSAWLHLKVVGQPSITGTYSDTLHFVVEFYSPDHSSQP